MLPPFGQAHTDTDALRPPSLSPFLPKSQAPAVPARRSDAQGRLRTPCSHSLLCYVPLSHANPFPRMYLHSRVHAGPNRAGQDDQMPKGAELRDSTGGQYGTEAAQAMSTFKASRGGGEQHPGLILGTHTAPSLASPLPTTPTHSPTHPLLLLSSCPNLSPPPPPPRRRSSPSRALPPALQRLWRRPSAWPASERQLPTPACLRRFLLCTGALASPGAGTPPGTLPPPTARGPSAPVEGGRPLSSTEHSVAQRSTAQHSAARPGARLWGGGRPLSSSYRGGAAAVAASSDRRATPLGRRRVDARSGCSLCSACL